jgi:MFS family permease
MADVPTRAELDRIYWSDKVTDEQQNAYPLLTSLSKIRKSIGHGTYTYFFLLQALIIVFGIMSIPAFTATILNYHGERFNNITNITAVRKATLENNIGAVPWHISVCDLTNVITFVLFLIYMRLYCPRVKRTQKASDFSVKVTRLPHDVTEDELRKYFTVFGQVHSICIALNNSTLLKTIAKQEQLLEKRKLLENDGKQPYEMRGGICGRGGDNIETITSKIFENQSEIETLQQVQYQCCGIAFISFEKQSSADLCIRSSTTNYFKGTSYKFRDMRTLGVTRAPDPSDIIWENLEHGLVSRMIRRLIAMLITYSIATVGVFVGLGIGGWVYENRFKNSNPPGGIFGILIAIIAVVLISLAIIAPALTKFEKHHMHSHLKLFAGIRLTLVDMVLAVATPISTYRFLFEHVGTGRLLDDQMPHIGLVIEIIIVLFLISLIIPLIYRTVVWYVVKRKPRTDHYLKKKFEGAEFRTDELHKLLVKSVWMSLFFSVLVPFMIIITFVGLICMYWISKYNLLRRYKRPSSNDNTISVVVIRYFLPAGIFAHLAVGTRLYRMQDDTSLSFLCMLVPLGLFLIMYGIGIVFDISAYLGSYFDIGRYSEQDELIGYSQVAGIETYCTVQPTQI